MFLPTVDEPELTTFPTLRDALPLSHNSSLLGAEDEVRTRDLQLGRLSLYQLSYFRKTDPVRRMTNRIRIVGRTGFEPVKS